MPEQNKKPMHRVPFYRRPLVIILCLAAIIIIAVAIVLIVKATASDEEITQTEPDGGVEDALVYSEEKDEELDLSPEDQKVIVQYEGENPNELDHLTGLITYTEVKDGKLLAMVSIDQYLSEGICTANLKNDSGIAATAKQPVEADASTSHCGPIAVSLSGVSGGKYQLEVVISSGDRTGTLTSNVEI